MKNRRGSWRQQQAALHKAPRSYQAPVSLRRCAPIEPDPDLWTIMSGDTPQDGDPGIVYFPGVNIETFFMDEHALESCEALVHYDPDRSVSGIFKYFAGNSPITAGTFTVLVRADRRRQGIATRLLADACRRWKIDFQRQAYTPDGLAFITSFLASKAKP
jgi:hypothetical protein